MNLKLLLSGLLSAKKKPKQDYNSITNIGVLADQCAEFNVPGEAFFKINGGDNTIIPLKYKSIDTLKNDTVTLWLEDEVSMIAAIGLIKDRKGVLVYLDGRKLGDNGDFVRLLNAERGVIPAKILSLTFGK